MSRSRFRRAMAHPFPLIAAVALSAEAVAAARTFGTHSQPPMTGDAAIFEHAGWYVTTGAVPYLDIWDPKPPLNVGTTGLFALVTSDPYLLHLLNAVAMAAAVVGLAVLVGWLVEYLTGEATAAVVGGVSVLVLPGLHYRALLGYKPKYMVALAGFLGIVLYLRGNPLLSGGAAAAAAGYWQLGVVFPLIVLGLAVDRGGRRDLVRVLAGMGAVTALAVVPIVLAGATVPMIVQAVIVPFLFPEPLKLPYRLYMGAQHFKYGSLLVLAGGVGLWRFARSDLVRREWWLLGGSACSAFIVLFVNFNFWSYTDLIPWVPFVAIAIGYLYHTLDRPDLRRALAAVLAAVVVLNVAALGGVSVVFDPVRTYEPVTLDGPPPTILDEVSGQYSPAPDDLVDVRYLYWHQLPPETCNYRFSFMELRWIRATGEYPNCGRDLGEALALLSDR